MAIEDEMKDVQQLVVNQLGVANGLTDNNLADGQVTPAKLDLRVGNVGVGTLTPSAKLTIEDSGHDLLTLNTTGADEARIKSNRGLQLHADHENNSGTSQGNIDLCTNGSIKMRVQDNGNVGIGTTSPSTNLEVKALNNADTTYILKLINSAESGFTQLGAYGIDTSAIDLILKAGGSEGLRVDKDSGRVGIGTTNPANELSVAGTINATTGLTVGAEDGGPSGGITSVGSTSNSVSVDADPNNAGANSLIGFNVDNTRRMTIKDDGNVGIGTNNPAKLLSVVSPNTASAETVAGFGNQNIERGLEIKTNGGTSSLEWGFNAVNSRHMVFDTNQTERMRITSDGNVGIGTSSPSHNLHVEDTSASIAVISGTSGNSTILLGDTADNNKGRIIYTQSIDAMKLLTNGSEAMRIDDSANVLVGKTTTAIGTAGSRFISNGQIQATASGNEPFLANRLSSDGMLFDFRKDGSTVGSIGVNGGALFIGGTDNNYGGLRFNNSPRAIVPAEHNGNTYDNSVDLGQSAVRFDDIYATNGTINTSDENEKQDIESLSEAEQRVAVACKGLLRKFRWKSAVEEKGEEARIHFGIIAQDLQAAFEAEGLDAGRYAMFISSTWWEKERVVPAVEEETDEEGNITTEAQESYTTVDTWDTEEEADEGATVKTRLGVRYSELLAFIISAI